MTNPESEPLQPFVNLSTAAEVSEAFDAAPQVDIFHGTYEDQMAAVKARADFIENRLQFEASAAETGRLQQEFKARRDAERSRPTREFMQKLGYPNDVIDGILGASVGFDRGLIGREDQTNPDKQLIAELVGEDTSSEAVRSAKTAVGIVREELRFANGDHDAARKEILKRYHPDVDQIGGENVLPWVGKLWDPEQKRFKL